MIDRRAFIAAAIVALAAPLAAEAQQTGKVWRIGVLFAGEPALSRGYPGLSLGLRELGYVDGQNVRLDVRSANGRYERLPGLAAELVNSKPDVIITSATPAAIAAKNATKTIPIVALVLGDPIGSGVATSLAHPEANVTGISLVNPELAVKRFDLMKQLLPQLSRLAILTNSLNPQHQRDVDGIRPLAKAGHVRVQVIDARRPEDVDSSLTTALKGRPDALLVLADSLLVSQRRAIIDFTRSHHLPDIHPYGEMAEEGGLMAYGLNFKDHYRRGATYVDRILKGTGPADLPFEQPTKFDLVINLKTAKALGLTIPQSLLVRADAIIQ